MLFAPACRWSMCCKWRKPWPLKCRQIFPTHKLGKPKRGWNPHLPDLRHISCRLLPPPEHRYRLGKRQSPKPGYCWYWQCVLRTVAVGLYINTRKDAVCVRETSQTTPSTLGTSLLFVHTRAPSATRSQRRSRRSSRTLKANVLSADVARLSEGLRETKHQQAEPSWKV